MASKKSSKAPAVKATKVPMGGQPIDDLRCDAIEVKPVSYSWDGDRFDYDQNGEGWHYLDAARCDKCGAVVTGQDESATHRDLDSESECDGSVSLSPPMMNYYYPIEIGDMDSVARVLGEAQLPLCVVSVDGTTGLALTGGGMDLSWEICEAFMRLGYLPPVHFADLPGIAGKGTDAVDLWVADGCVKACEVASMWATGKAKRIREMMAQLKRDAHKRAK